MPTATGGILMFRYQRLALLTLVMGLLGMTGLAADEAAHRQAVARLFELTAMQQKIEASVDTVLAMQLAQNPELQSQAGTVREFLERHVGWDSMQGVLTDLYLQEFSEQEINEMNAFYSTPTGRKVIERLPLLVQMRNQIAAQRLQDNIGELEHEINSSR